MCFGAFATSQYWFKQFAGAIAHCLFQRSLVIGFWFGKHSARIVLMPLNWNGVRLQQFLASIQSLCLQLVSNADSHWPCTLCNLNLNGIFYATMLHGWEKPYSSRFQSEDCVYLRETSPLLLQTLNALEPDKVIWAQEMRGIEEDDILIFKKSSFAVESHENLYSLCMIAQTGVQRASLCQWYLRLASK